MRADRAAEVGARRQQAAVVVLAVALAALGAATLLNHGRIEPFTTWYYIFAWYPTLAVLDAVIALRRGRFLLVSRPRAALLLFAWSVPAWMFFELLNLRIENWFYVFVPDRRAAAWAGITLSFGTVLPAVFLSATAAAEVLRLHGVRWRPLRVTPRLQAVLQASGLAMLVLPLLWPTWFFALVWGALTLMLEPVNYRRDATRSLLADLEAGRPQRLLALLAGGAAIGFLWELYNAEARGKWIYTVPGLDALKLFEMPLLGFLGFPVFALGCFALVQWLVLADLAADVPGAAERGASGSSSTAAPEVGGPASAARGAPVRRRVVALGAGALFVIAMLLAMERRTISSTTPRLRDLPGLFPWQVEDLVARGVGDPFVLARQDARELARRVPGAEPEDVEQWVRAARLATLRGLGTAWATRLWRIGVRSVEELAAADAGALVGCLTRNSSPHLNVRRVRVWVRAAQRAADATADRGGAGFVCAE